MRDDEGTNVASKDPGDMLSIPLGSGVNGMVLGKMLGLLLVGERVGSEVEGSGHIIKDTFPSKVKIFGQPKNKVAEN